MIKTNEIPDKLPQPELLDESPPVSFQSVKDSSPEPAEADEETQERTIQALIESIRAVIHGILARSPGNQQAVEQNGIAPDHATLRYQRVTPLMPTEPHDQYYLQYLAEVRAKHEKETGTPWSALETANALTQQDLLEIYRRITAFKNDTNTNDQTTHPFYKLSRNGDEKTLQARFWPGTKCRLVNKLLQARFWPGIKCRPVNKLHDLKNPTDEESILKPESTNITYTIVRIMRQDTKRIIMNRHQFAVFNDIAHQQTPENAFSDLRWPFDDDMYVEFDQPFAEEDEHGSLSIEGFMVIGQGDIRTVCFTIFANEAYEIRTFEMDISTGKEVTPIFLSLEDMDHTLPRAICLTMSYMTARGIKIVEEPLPRNVRRRLDRKNMTNPWHVITAENPSKRYQGSEDPTAGPKHSYRYDVIGHFRFGRHPLSDGSHRTTREWVKPHQRGLQNVNYIPAVRRFNEPEQTPNNDDKHLPDAGR